VFAKIEPDLIQELVERFRGEAETPELPPLSYAIDPSIDYDSLVVELSGITVKSKHPKLEKLKRELVAELDLAAHRKSRVLEPYVRLLEERDLGGRAPSALNLIDIVERSGKLPTINTLVDAYNLQSLKHATVMGAYDRRALTGNLRMKVADGREHFVPVAGRDPEPLRPGEWVIVDEEDRVVTKIVSKQSEAVAVTTDTTGAAMCIQGNPEISTEELHRITVETCELVQRICGGTWRIVNEA
jgi:methionyl-tRNA synthetase